MPKVAVFSAKSYDKKYLGETHAQLCESPSSSGSQLQDVELVFHEPALNTSTVQLAQGAEAVCVFVNDSLDESVLDGLHKAGVRAVLLRCAGSNNVDLKAAEKLGMLVANVPAYSPEAVAEFALALIQTVNRKTHRAYNRVREGNFNLDGLLGRTLYGKTVGLVGTGRIGVALARILKGCGCKLLAFDPVQNDAFKELGEYVDLETLLPQADIVSLHCPLMEKTKHIINEDSLAKMKEGAILVNTSRGGLINTKAVISALKSGQLGGLALDVYEGEGSLFYNDHSGESAFIGDSELMRITTFPNAFVSGHQAFFTEEALTEIASTTLANLDEFLRGAECKNALVKPGGGDIGNDNKAGSNVPIRT